LAVESGFQAIDTANQIVHYNEELVGRALQALSQKGIKRENLFLQTKFTSVDGQRGQTPYDAKAALTAQVNQSMDSSLLHLHTDYVDSYVLHGPYERYKLGAADWEVWTAIAALYDAGKARMIGISNVTAEQLEELCAGAKVKPMMVQNRCYAVTGWDHEVREICRQHGIIYQGFSLLTANANIMAESSIQAIARRLNTGVAQVIFRFAMQVGMLPLTGTSNAQHMKEDLAAEHLQLTDEETRLIAMIGLQTRF
ncbi:MAG: aldo/keto reductase, partial [Cyanobacteria bacterium REEB67]|nr:aldo/keto reductase [Cyanobacteria bacterium REEB67]